MLRIFFIIAVFLFSSCEKELDLKLKDAKKHLAVFGAIEPELPAYVVLSKSQNFYSPIDGVILDDIYVDDATVSVKRNDGVMHHLTLINQEILDSIADELQIPNIESPFHSVYIDINPDYEDFAQNDYSYQLKINWNNEVIEATTYIPPPIDIDSVWCKCKEDIGEEYKCYIWASINDPDTLGNNIFATFKRTYGSYQTESKFMKTARSLRSDFLYNGSRFTTSFARSGRVMDESGGFAPFYADREINGFDLPKDQVLFKLSQIDNNTYQFWRSLIKQDELSNNPFSEPVNLESNIKGGLGIWAGYGATYYKIPIVKDTIIYDNILPNLLEIF